jgi:Fibronectin type III domain
VYWLQHLRSLTALAHAHSILTLLYTDTHIASDTASYLPSSYVYSLSTALEALLTTATVSMQPEDLLAGFGYAWRVTVMNKTNAQPLLLLEAYTVNTELFGVSTAQLAVTSVTPTTYLSFNQNAAALGFNALPQLSSAELGSAAAVHSIWVVARAANHNGTFYITFIEHTGFTAAVSAASGLAAVDVLTALQSLTAVPTVVPLSVAAGSSGRSWQVTFSATVGSTPALMVSTSPTLAAGTAAKAAAGATGLVATAGGLAGNAARVYTTVDTQGRLRTSFVTLQGLLTPGAQYYTRKAVYTAASDWRVPTTAAAAGTTAVLPPSPPLNVTAATASATTMTVPWRAPRTSSGYPVAYFSVQFNTDSGYTAAAAAATGAAAVSTPTASYTITSLASKSSHYVRVAAGNAAGCSELSGAAAKGTTEPQIIVFTAAGATGSYLEAALAGGLFKITVTDPLTVVRSSTQASHFTVRLPLVT